jgi:hypothetical protein
VGGLPREGLKEPEQAGCNRKRKRTCLAERRQNLLGQNPKGKDTCSCSSVEEDGSRLDEDEEDSNPSPVTNSARIGACPVQEVVQEEATTHREIPTGWTRIA